MPPERPSAPPPAARSAAQLRSDRLPNFPWDRLAPAKATAAAHPGGLVDLSIGTPVDPTPDFIQQAAHDATNAPGYPTVWGTPELRSAIRTYLEGHCSAVTLDEGCVLPTVGSKEFIAALPAQLGVGPGHTVLGPRLAYPTYAVGALLAGAQYVADDSTVAVGPRDVPLVWINTPGNPTGRVLPVEHLRKVVTWARERGAVVASDECYLEYCWDAEPVSVLSGDVNGGSLESVLAVHSLSKRSNMAGYRAAYVAGDPVLLRRLHEVRRHAGLIVPAPVQAAMLAALEDQGHVAQQRERYRKRRGTLLSALRAAGFQVDESDGSLYLWATRGRPAMQTVEELAGLGILVAPGDLYGPTGAAHIRVALTATDERISTAADRLTTV